MGDFSILVLDDDIYSLENIKLALADFNEYNVVTAADSRAAEKLLKQNKFNLLITDLRLPCKDGLEFAEEAKKKGLINDAILITGFGDEKTIEKAIKIGIRDFLRKPYEETEFLNSVRKVYENYLLKLENEELKKKLKIENRILRQQVLKDAAKNRIIGQDEQFKLKLKKALEIAKYSENVLIYGESGTGKELLAKFIHLNGPRKDKPYIAVNCAALSPSLFESELFGYKRGAFTGANEDRPGLFELADGGILFLDEISEISKELQAKLLRVIETGEIKRVGDVKNRKIDVQIISTTNRTIEELASGEILRQDLFHRLTSSSIHLPPLRMRKSDIPLLLQYFLNEFNERYEKNISIPKKSILYNKLINYGWPGNIRQLKNFVKNYVLFEPSPDEASKLLEDDFTENNGELSFRFQFGTLSELEEAKVWLISKILKKYNYNKLRTAKHLGMSYPGLLALIKRHNLI